MWQCRRCDSEVAEAIPGCPRCAFRIDTESLALAAQDPRMAAALADPRVQAGTVVAPAVVIGMRYADAQTKNVGRVVHHAVDLALPGQPARTLSVGGVLAPPERPDVALLGSVVIALIDGDRLVEWAPIGAPDREPARVAESLAPPSVRGVPDGFSPLTGPDGALIGLPGEQVAPRVQAAASHPELSRVMSTEVRGGRVTGSDLYLIAFGLFVAVVFWIAVPGYGKTFDELPPAALWIGVATSVVGAILIGVAARNVRRRGARGLSAGQVGVACFRDGDGLAFLPLPG